MTRLIAVLLLMGLLVLVALVFHTGPAALAAELSRVGWKVLWILVPSVGVYVLDARGWRVTLGRHAERLSFRRLFMVRMSGEAVNFTTPPSYLCGELMKGYQFTRQ